MSAPAASPKRSRRPLWVIGAIFVLVLAGILFVRHAGASLGCGRQQIAKPGGGAWTCTFDDEFSRGELDTGLWRVTTTAATGFHGGPECLVDSPANVATYGGMLHLTVRRTAAPFRCATPQGSYLTDYTSGSVSTKGTFAQAYGRFEVRARFPEPDEPGLYSGLWLYPETLSYGRWPASGEIDLAENYSVWPNRVNEQLHYDPAADDTRSVRPECRVEDPALFHDYVLVWSPRHITMAYDGHTCWSTTWKAAAPLRSGAPFDKPFYLVINEAIGTGVDAPSPALTLPRELDVDFVRVWK